MELNGDSLLVESVKVPVHDVNSKEESLICAFKGGKHFYHPVNHFSSVNTINLVVGHVSLLHSVLSFKSLEIVVNVATIITHKIVLSIEIEKAR
jgi:hypothetical protein